MNKIFSEQSKAPCRCDDIPKITHELSQSLLIIHAYVKGCTERIKNNNLDLVHLDAILNKISNQVESMGNTIHALNAI